jgi:cardiolipin synthase
VKPRDIPNLLTILRFFFAPVIVYFLLQRQFGAALILFAVAGFTDGLDGFLAKHYNWQSRLGSLLDPLADKVLLLTAMVCLAWLELIPWWLFAAVILRDLVIVAGALTYHFRVEPLEAAPTFISKLNTLVQILLVILVVADAGPLDLPGPLVQVLVWATLATTVLSGVDYVVVWNRLARSKGWRNKPDN